MHIPSDLAEQIHDRTGADVEAALTAQRELGVFTDDHAHLQAVIDATCAICDVRLDTVITEPGDGHYVFFVPR